MSTKAVYSIRVSGELRKTMDELTEVNWQEEIRSIVEELVKNKSKEKLLADAKAIRKAMKANVSAAELIRADRDAR